MEAKTAPVWEKAGYTLRLARREDAEAYYAQNFAPLDPEAARMTGSQAQFTREEVVAFLRESVEDGERYHFLILSPEGRIIGESVLNEIDWDLRCANFRIGIFHPDQRGKGIGTWAVRQTRDFAFSQLHLHRLELDVYSFNPRAERVSGQPAFAGRGSCGMPSGMGMPMPMRFSWPCWRTNGAPYRRKTNQNHNGTGPAAVQNCGGPGFCYS